MAETLAWSIVSTSICIDILAVIELITQKVHQGARLGLFESSKMVLRICCTASMGFHKFAKGMKYHPTAQPGVMKLLRLSIIQVFFIMR